MSNHLQQAIEALRKDPDDTDEVKELKIRIRVLESNIVRLEWDLFRLISGDEEVDRKCISIMTIAEMVGVRTGFTLLEMRSRRRHKPLSYARHLFWYLAKEHTKRSLPVLGRFLEKDHTSVIHGIMMTKRRMAEDPGMLNLAMEISSDIRALQETS